ncbi:EamA/RhaT family transporter [bacterium]|nr:MAG: EamA/RhaT family transporter [bacterium]
MHFLILSVLCSVAVSVLLRRAKQWKVDATQAVTWNYAMAATLCAVLLKPSLQPLRESGAPWPEILILAIALPAIFLVFARTLNLAGIARSDAAQRLSLLLSLSAAFLFFGEKINAFKLAGLAVGALALLGILSKPAQSSVAWKQVWPWLFGVCAGYAFIDILLKRIALHGVASMAALQISFILAFGLMLSWQLVNAWRGKVRLSVRNLLAGLFLGALNLGNIFFYVKAHQAFSHSPSTVFATMNVGVVALGTLVGVLVFKEKTSTWNRVGLGLAVVSILLVAIGAKS